MASYLVVYNPCDPIVFNTKPSDRDNTLTREAIRMILSPDVLIQAIEYGGGWLVRMDTIDGIGYMCLVTSVHMASSKKLLMENIRIEAEKLLYSMPSAEIAWLKVTVDDDLIYRQTNLKQ